MRFPYDQATIFGMGREGMSAKAYLEKHFPHIEIKTVEDPLAEPLSGLVVKSPGISLYRNDILEAKKQGAVFTSATNLFLNHCYGMEKRPFLIGVTGTKGKSTTSALIAHCLNAFGKKTALGGNFGTPLLDFADDLPNLDFIVAEVSSYQASDLARSFDICVVLNLYEEHLDWHKTHEQYYLDKLNIFRHQEKGRKTVLNREDKTTGRLVPDLPQAVYFNGESGFHIKDGFFFEGQEKLFPTASLPLKGEHNLINACAALSVLKLAVSADILKGEAAFKTFKPLPHRLEIVLEKDGITFVNDSISTTPETAIAALKAFAPVPTILIAGGYDRGQNYEALAEYISKGGAKAVVTLPQTGPRLAASVRKAGGISLEARTMEEALKKAKELAVSGDIVLLSPAAPSYGVYKNFEERGQIFTAAASFPLDTNL